jgi:uncharacterized membrane protein
VRINVMRVLKVLKVCLMVVVVAVVMSFVVKELWNWLMPGLFGLRVITWAQALGLLVLSKVLLGGFHKHGGGGRGWQRGTRDRWDRMTPEDRERFSAGMEARIKCGFGRRTETPVTAEERVV